MKKFYLSLILLLSSLCILPVQAREVVQEIGQLMTNLSQIKTGDKLLFFCNGPIDPENKEYGLRQAYLREGNNHQLFISRELELNAMSSSDFIWTVLSYEPVENDALSYTIKLKSPRGNNLPVFPYQANKKPKWPGMTVDPEEGETATYTITCNEEGDSLYLIKDENGIFFNGQSIAENASPAQARFVGWNSPTDNSLYKIYIPKVVEKETYQVTMVLNDENGEKDENSVIQVEGLIGDTIKAPQWEHHTFHNAIDGDTEKPVEFPYVIDGTEPFLLLNYETWPYMIVTGTLENTEEIIYYFEDYVKKGSRLPMPTKEELGVGYSLVTEGYEDYVVTEDAEISLVFRRDGNGLPFVATTLQNDEFAADTKWYLMKVNGTKTMNYDAETGAVTCGEVTSYSDANLWAFVGDLENGYQVYNKAAGTAKILWSADSSNGSQVMMTDVADTQDPKTFDIAFNENGFSWKLHGTPLSFLNDFGGKGILKFWVNAKAEKAPGSRFTFFEYTEDLANALTYGEYLSYLQAEDCVGGWTAAQLAELKQAYAAKDTTACRTAVNHLAEVETIAFDEKKSYAIISAFREFLAYQPKSVYAMAQEADSAMVWKSLVETNPAFQFGFNVASDSTCYIVSALNQLPIGGFRFGDFAKCVEWGDMSVEENLVKVGHPAAFKMVKNATTPASFYFVHNYGPSIITLSADPHKDGKATSGKINTYNTQGGAYNNYWRLKPVGEWSSIEDVEVITPAQQKQVIYDLSGRKVAKAVKGLYIINGKKVYVK